MNFTILFSHDPAEMKFLLISFPVLSTLSYNITLFYYPKIVVNTYLCICTTVVEVVSSILGCVYFSVERLKVNYLAFTIVFYCWV